MEQQFSPLAFSEKIFHDFKPSSIGVFFNSNRLYIKKTGVIITPVFFSLKELITLQLQEQLELLVETHQLLDLEGSCERYARALLPYLGLNG